MSILSPSGERKILKAIKVARKAAMQALKHNVEAYIVPEIQKRAPSKTQEEVILLSGQDGVFGKRYTDSKGGDTYIEEMRTSLHDAIGRDVVDLKLDGTTILCRTGHPDFINELTKMYWSNRHNAGGIKTTWPFHYRYVQSVEFGGTWEVRPRGETSPDNPSGYPLRPEKIVTADVMHKSVSPHKMYRGAVRRGNPVMNRVIKNIGRYVKGEVSFATRNR